MKIHRTHDMELVATIMGHPAIFKHIAEDGTVSPEPIDHPGFFWLAAYHGPHIAGMFLVHPVSTVCYEMHTMILPSFWGDPASAAAQALLEWVFTQTPCEKLVTRIPVYNRAARRFALTNGMQQEGVNRQSFLRNNELIDQINLGITRKEWLCRQQSSQQ